MISINCLSGLLSRSCDKISDQTFSKRIIVALQACNNRISSILLYHMSLVMRKPAFCKHAKTKTQISFAVTAKLISALVFARQILQSLFFLNPKFQASSHLLWLYSPICVGPGRKPRIPVFSQRGSYNLCHTKTCFCICLQQTSRSAVHPGKQIGAFVFHSLNSI